MSWKNRLGLGHGQPSLMRRLPERPDEVYSSATEADLSDVCESAPSTVTIERVANIERMPRRARQ